jgi:type IV secretory pathway TrbF-like protein
MATPLPDYLAAREAHETRWDRLAMGKRNWQIVATILLALDVFLTVAFIQSARRSSVVPYVVEVDHHGNALSVGPAAALNLPDTLLWRYVLAVFIRNLRTVPSDPEALNLHLQDAAAFLRGHAVSTVRQSFERASPFELAKTESVNVSPDISILRRGERHWQIEWTEIHNDRSGQRHEERWQALVTTEVDPPHRLDLLLANPIGFFIVDLDWTRVH